MAQIISMADKNKIKVTIATKLQGHDMERGITMKIDGVVKIDAPVVSMEYLGRQLTRQAGRISPNKQVQIAVVVVVGYADHPGAIATYELLGVITAVPS